ncbi:hypothetical protein Lfu02_35920 [Longispora fulva]|uniref:Actin-like ATPase involved in cell morphogenesis n=1 Tax=Longispora fulva TaxID=619741 RepID=A0A8J7GNC7_9ACTN|nr:Hsp70 family protein [Longispora fulva]MBG6141626.1 actin-like ATPase involved in cell morphogenesis [Longispora fulva]GIG59220.1 hypothetical protein Lfu02_35920 [Longispora fulva]
MTEHQLAVDYGTSHTVAMLGFPDGRVRPLLFDGAPLLPSAVFAQPDGTVLTGRDAQHGARLYPASFEPNPKRRIDDVTILLGERTWSVVDLAAHTLRRVATEAARTAGGPVTELVMTCPVEWGPVRRETLIQAAALAGLPRPTLVAEPVAAAAHHGRDVADGRCVVVYDLGGGTFDVCVLRRVAGGFRPLAHHGIDDFGGVDLDALVMAQISEAVAPELWQRVDRRQLRALWDDARMAKEALSRQSSAQVFVPLVEREVPVTREAFERAARGALGRTVDVTMATLRESQVAPSEVAGVFLVGGSSRVPMVGTLLHQATGIAPTVVEQPETVVAEGALRVGGGARLGAPPATAEPALPGAPGLSAPASRGPGLGGPTSAGTPLSGPVPPGPGPAYAAAGSPARPGAHRLIPALGGVLMLLGVVVVLATPSVASDWITMMAGCAAGSVLLCCGGIATWFWQRLPPPARFAVPGAHLLLSLWWYSGGRGTQIDLALTSAEITMSYWLLAGVTVGMLALTAATLHLRHREVRDGL